MKDLQAYVQKIRSDAAECLMLSSIVNDGQDLFTGIARHLNSLAFELENNGMPTLAAGATAAPDERPFQVVPSPVERPAKRSWRTGPLLFLFFLVIVAGAGVWVLNWTGSLPIANYWLLKSEPSSPPNNQAAQKQPTQLADEIGQRKLLSEQLSATIERLDTLAKSLEDLKALRSGVALSANEAPASQPDRSPRTEAIVPQVEAKRIPPGDAPAPSERKDGPPTTAANSSAEPVDSVGAISPRAELNPARSIGPVGCTHFRSFDAVSGTYTTLDGRRRTCR